MDRLPAFRRVILADVSFGKGLAWSGAAIAAPTFLRWAIDNGEAGIPFVTYFPAVILSALLLGWRWGAAVALASGMLANRLFRQEAALGLGSGDAVLVALFLMSCLALVWIGEMCRRLVRELEAGKVREELLNQELMHRVKNMLATVNAMAVLTARHCQPGEFTTAFSGRMKALDRATELLGAGNAARCEARELVERAIEPFRTDGNFKIEGPDCRLPRDACVPLSLALHELCTNAAKHGALTSPQGKVRLAWIRDERARLTFRWREEGGPPVPEQRRAGMGTQLLRAQRGLAAVELRFPRGGIECDIEIQMEDEEVS